MVGGIQVKDGDVEMGIVQWVEEAEVNMIVTNSILLDNFI